MYKLGIICRTALVSCPWSYANICGGFTPSVQLPTNHGILMNVVDRRPGSFDRLINRPFPWSHHKRCSPFCTSVPCHWASHSVSSPVANGIEMRCLVFPWVFLPARNLDSASHFPETQTSKSMPACAHVSAQPSPDQRKPMSRIWRRCKPGDLARLDGRRTEPNLIVRCFACLEDPLARRPGGTTTCHRVVPTSGVELYRGLRRARRRTVTGVGSCMVGLRSIYHVGLDPGVHGTAVPEWPEWESQLTRHGKVDLGWG